MLDRKSLPGIYVIYNNICVTHYNFLMKSGFTTIIHYIFLPVPLAYEGIDL